MFTASWHLFSEKPPAYANRIVGTLTVDGLPYEGIVFALAVGKLSYISGQHVKNGDFHIQLIPEKYSTKTLNLLVFKDGRALASEPVTPDSVVVYDLTISTSGGGGAPTGDPATISGKVERVLDNLAEPAARQLVAIEHKPDGTWAVIGNTTSDAGNGSYTLDVLTEGGDTFVLTMDEYGVPFTATASVVQGELIHPTVPNGHVYRVEAGGNLPATEPTWWIDTGTNHTRTIEGD
ncbi:hypothetical protein J7439_24930, partial [Salinisphaera sp. G21_0]